MACPCKQSRAVHLPNAKKNSASLEKMVEKAMVKQHRALYSVESKLAQMQILYQDDQVTNIEEITKMIKGLFIELVEQPPLMCCVVGST